MILQLRAVRKKKNTVAKYTGTTVKVMWTFTRITDVSQSFFRHEFICISSPPLLVFPITSFFPFFSIV